MEICETCEEEQDIFECLECSYIACQWCQDEHKHGMLRSEWKERCEIERAEMKEDY